MRVKLFEQFKRNGTRFEKPIGFICDLNLDNTKARCFDIDPPFRQLCDPLYVNSVLISADGFTLKGLQTSDEKRWWVQEWYCIPYLLK